MVQTTVSQNLGQTDITAKRGLLGSVRRIWTMNFSDRCMDSGVPKGRWLFRKLQRTLDSAWGWFPITPFGVGSLFILWYFARQQSDLIVTAVCGAGIACIALNVAQVVVTAFWMRLQRMPAVDTLLELEARTACSTEFQLGWFGWNPLVQFQVRLEEPTGVQVLPFESTGSYRERVISDERCSARHMVRIVSVSDLFGLARVSFRRTAHRPVRCLPWKGHSPAFALIQQFRSGDALGHPDGEPVGDLVEMRRYAAGDPLKLVLWKAYARTGRLLVRTPERSLSPTDRTLVHLVAGPGDEPSAGIVRNALECGLLGSEVVFMADGAAEPARSLAESIEQIVDSKKYRDRGGCRLDDFLVQGETKGVSSAWIFLPSRSGQWLERVCDTLGRHRGPFSIVVGIDAQPHGDHGNTWSRWLRPSTDESIPTWEELRHICDRLNGVGANVRVVNRFTGEEVPSDRNAETER